MAPTFLPPGFFDLVADVYTRTASGGFTTKVKDDLACRVDDVNVQPATTGAERADLASHAEFRFDPAYTPPSDAWQLDLNDGSGVARWNPIVATLKAARGPGNTVPFKHCLIRKVPS